MRLALPGSLLVHAGVLGFMLAGFTWPEAEDAAAPAPVTINIVPVSNIGSNATEVVESENTVSALSAGSTRTSIQAEEPELVEPVSEMAAPETTERVEAASPAAPLQAIAAEPVESEPAEAIAMSELSSTALSEVSAAPLAPLVNADKASAAPQSATLIQPQEPKKIQPSDAPVIEPNSSADLANAPVPQTLSFDRPTAPIVHKPRPQPEQATKPTRKPRIEPQSAGNGGTSKADAVAAAGGSKAQQSAQGSGGEAAKARYKSIVQNRLRQSMGRYTGQAGNIVLSFTIHANGQISEVSVGGTSDAALNGAAMALIERAAPFPAIPPETGLSTWPFTVPLTFRGR